MSKADTIESITTSFLSEIDPEGRMNLTACLQCGRCSSGCTMRVETDLLPHQLNRLVALGLSEKLLASRAIWLCASCHTCVSRCPMKVDTPMLIDKLRTRAKSAPAELERVRVFNETMLFSMRRYGRVYEFGLMGVYKLRSRDLFSDLDKLPKMLRKGKMRLLPPRVRGRKAVAQIFRRIRHRARGQARNQA